MKHFQLSVNRVVYKYAFLSTLVFTIAQQIYWPQEQKYFHMAIMFVYMAFNDLIAHDYRNITRDFLFLGSIVSCSIVSILEYIVPLDISFLYQFFLIVAGVISINFFFKLREQIHIQNKEVIDKNHWRIFEKSTLFLEIMLFGAMLTTVLAVIYVISKIFI